MKRILALILAFAAFSGIAYAHNGVEHIMGTVTEVSTTSISVKTTDGKIRTIPLAASTKYTKGTSAMSLTDVKVGDHVVVNASEKDQKLPALEVKIGAMPGMGGMSGMKMDHPAATTPH